jgi:hypothetical protein
VSKLKIAQLISVDESLYHISLSQQLMPYLGNQTLQPTDPKAKTDLGQAGLVSDPMMGGMLGTGALPFDFYAQPLNTEGNFNLQFYVTSKGKTYFLTTYYCRTPTSGILSLVPN